MAEATDRMLVDKTVAEYALRAYRLVGDKEDDTLSLVGSEAWAHAQWWRHRAEMLYLQGQTDLPAAAAEVREATHKALAAGKDDHA